MSSGPGSNLNNSDVHPSLSGSIPAESGAYLEGLAPPAIVQQQGRKAPVGELGELVERSQSRDCLQALDLIERSLQTYATKHEPCEVPFNAAGEKQIDTASVQQYGRLLYLPRVLGGSAYIVSDLEGHFEAVETIFRRHDILQRLRANDPKDQVHFICLGDTIDRAGLQASRIFEFLLELKIERGFEDKIHILAGNHELDPDGAQRHPDMGGFFSEVVHFRRSYSELGDETSPLVQKILHWHNESFPGETPDDAPQLRMALWRRFNALFRLLPTTVVSNNGLVLAHAGLTDTGFFRCVANPADPYRPSFREAMEWLMGRPLSGAALSSEEQEALDQLLSHSVQDLTWSDFKKDIEGTAPNDARKCGLYFGLAALRAYLECAGARVMIRGHQRNVPDGAHPVGLDVWTAGNELLTLSTSPSVRVFEAKDAAQGFVVRSLGSYVEVTLHYDIDSVEDIKVHNLA